MVARVASNMVGGERGAPVCIANEGVQVEGCVIGGEGVEGVPNVSRIMGSSLLVELVEWSGCNTLVAKGEMEGGGGTHHAQVGGMPCCA